MQPQKEGIYRSQYRRNEQPEDHEHNPGKRSQGHRSKLGHFVVTLTESLRQPQPKSRNVDPKEIWKKVRGRKNGI